MCIAYNTIVTRMSRCEKLRLRLCLFLHIAYLVFFFFFFQAEDGIRDLTVTGVQTCALPISAGGEDRVEAGQVAPPDGRQPRREQADRGQARERENRTHVHVANIRERLTPAQAAA